MTFILVFIMCFFWGMLLYYSILTIAGVYHYIRKKEISLEQYPSVDILIPAHDEEVVIGKTLEAMSKLQYPGELHVYVLNDNSKDKTEGIADSFDSMYQHIHHIKVPKGEPTGKSRVLNYGLSISKSDYFLVFDADNQPEPNAVKLLVEYAEMTKNAAGAVGYVHTINSEKNFLTRMISLEFQVHQLLMQCGRWMLFNAGSLTGTNMLLKRSVINELGGYDPYALAEDAELTIRITSKGWTLPIVPHSKTWEQEPETVKALIKQRTRWLQGNLYLLEKMLKEKRYWMNRTFIHTIQHFSVYLFFVLFLFISHVFFAFGLLGMHLFYTNSPLIMLWFMSYVVYTIQHLSAMVMNKNITGRNFLIATLMYFTYSQLFLMLLVRSSFLYLNSKRKKLDIVWDKTARF